jgi:hypothetical protein
MICIGNQLGMVLLVRGLFLWLSNISEAWLEGEKTLDFISLKWDKGMMC